MPAALAMARITAGQMMMERFLRGSSVKLTQSVASGVQFHQRAGSETTRIATQKLGTEMPAMVTPRKM